MSFTNPTYLWALLGILIPLAIHLWSKKEGKTIKVGSIKLLHEEDSKQSSSISLNEILLLILRLFIIALVVFIMAEPNIKRKALYTPITYIVEPSLLRNDKLTPLIDSLENESSVLLLQSKFPKIEALNLLEISSSKTPNYWQLAKDMETLKTDSIVVFTSGLLKGLKGGRPTVQKNIEWLIFNEQKPNKQLVEAFLKKDSIQLLSIINESNNLAFKKEKLSINSSKIEFNTAKDSIAFNQNNASLKHVLEAEQPLNVLLYYEDKFKNEALYLEASLNTISKYLSYPIKINKTQDSIGQKISDYVNIIWLSETDFPKSLTTNRVLYFKADELANAIISKGQSKNEFYISQPLSPKNIIDKNLTKQLITWLNFHPELEEKINYLDKRVVSKAELLPIYKEGSEKSNSYIETWSMTKWLWVLLGLFLIFERGIAYLKKQ